MNAGEKWCRKVISGSLSLSPTLSYLMTTGKRRGSIYIGRLAPNRKASQRMMPAHMNTSSQVPLHTTQYSSYFSNTPCFWLSIPIWVSELVKAIGRLPRLLRLLLHGWQKNNTQVGWCYRDVYCPRPVRNTRRGNSRGDIIGSNRDQSVNYLGIPTQRRYSNPAISCHIF